MSLWRIHKKKLDKALKRNLEGQTKPVPASSPKPATNELQEEEPLADNEDNEETMED